MRPRKPSNARTFAGWPLCRLRLAGWLTGRQAGRPVGLAEPRMHARPDTLRVYVRLYLALPLFLVGILHIIVQIYYTSRLKGTQIDRQPSHTTHAQYRQTAERGELHGGVLPVFFFFFLLVVAVVVFLAAWLGI